VRFGLRKLPLAPKEGTDVEIVSQSFFLFEIPADHSVVDLYENDEVKGVKLKVIGVKSSSKSGFSML
jgi:hypothetical protein